MTIIIDTSTSSATLGDIRDLIQYKGYGTDTASPEQTSMINSIYRRVLGMRRWWFFEVVKNTTLTLTSGDSSKSLSGITDFFLLDAVRLSAASATYNSPLEWLPIQEFREVSNYAPEDSGTPQYWTRVNDTLYFWPEADAAFTLEVDYIKQPPDLVNDSDIPLIPAPYIDVLVWGAIKELTFRERDDSGRAYASEEYQSILSDMIHQDGLEQRQTPSEVGYSGVSSSVNRGYVTA